MIATKVVCKSSAVHCQSAALGIAVVASLVTLEPDFNFVLPESRFLPDTNPKYSQWNRAKRYFGESLHGADWPDRWLFTFEKAA